MTTHTRIDKRFAALKSEGRAALVTFVTAGDPDYETSREILLGLAGAGADVIELGMPFQIPWLMALRSRQHPFAHSMPART